jgi:hypothetical protein
LAELVKPEGGGHVFLRTLDSVPFRWENRNPKATSSYGKGFNREYGLVGGWYDKIGYLNEYYMGKDLTVGTDTGAPVPELTIAGYGYQAASWDPSGITVEPVINSSGMITGLAAPAGNTAGLKIGLTRATGIFKGSFKAWFNGSPRSISYEGVLIPEREDKEDGVEGRGFFLWSDPSPGYPFKWSYDFLIQGQ